MSSFVVMFGCFVLCFRMSGAMDARIDAMSSRNWAGVMNRSGLSILLFGVLDFATPNCVIASLCSGSSWNVDSMRISETRAPQHSSAAMACCGQSASAAIPISTHRVTSSYLITLTAELAAITLWPYAVLIVLVSALVMLRCLYVYSYTGLPLAQREDIALRILEKRTARV